MTQTGVVVGGDVMPGTGWVMREADAWWATGERGTRPRESQPATLLVGHWTAGQPHEGPTASRRVVRNMKARKRDDGSPMSVGVHFVISADGIVTQTADLAVGTAHVGSPVWNMRSIGVECTWPGSASLAHKLNVAGRVVSERIAGSRIEIVVMPDALLAAWVRLAETLASLPAECGVAIPRLVPLAADGALLRDRMTSGAARRWAGAAEHYHVPTTTKVDAGSRLIGALRDAGWQGRIA